MSTKRIAESCLVALVALFNSQSLIAQDSEFTPLGQPLDFLAVKDEHLMTTATFSGGDIMGTDSSKLYAGIESFSINIFNYKEIDRNATIPSNLTFALEITDKAGNVVAQNDMQLESSLKKIRYVTKFSTTVILGTTIIRGGEYRLKASITPDMYVYERDIVLEDNPCMQIMSDSECTVDAIPSTQLLLSSGYPYTPSDFAGEKSLHWSVAPVGAPEKVISEGTESFELKSDTPTLAAIAELQLFPPAFEPGEYLYTFTSDFAPANTTFKLKVFDKLLPEISLDKTVYTVGEKEAIIKVDMDYGYPYVGENTDTGKPTIEVTADLLEEQTTAEYTDAVWADSDVHCEAELHVPLDKITSEIAASYAGQVPMDLSILFNGSEKFKMTLPLPFNVGVGVQDVTVDGQEHDNVKYYNILGVEVDSTYRGLVITSDGRKIFR